MAAATIVKADGSREPFVKDKLVASLTRSGATREVALSVADEIAAEIFDGETTKEIYRRAFALLRESEKPSAAKYSLRRSLFELGPSGFPFEKFIAEIFEAKNYKTAVGATIVGKCIPHEVDVVAQNDEESIAIEAKFHSKQSFRSDAKVALYTKARMDDIAGGSCEEFGGCTIKRGILITNTKLTSNARKYALCAGLGVISWEYPSSGNLADLISETRVYPITCLTTLTSSEKKRLLEHHVSLCKTLEQNQSALRDIGMSPQKMELVLEEGRRLCSGETPVE